MDSLPPLNGSNHTIFGRLISGRETLKQIEGIDEFKKQLAIQKTGKDQPIEKSKIYIKNAGVYKFEAKASEMRRRSAAGVYDFKPEDFYESRRNK